MRKIAFQDLHHRKKIPVQEEVLCGGPLHLPDKETLSKGLRPVPCSKASFPVAAPHPLGDGLFLEGREWGGWPGLSFSAFREDCPLTLIHPGPRRLQMPAWYCSIPPLSAVSLPAVSVALRQLWSENIEWKNSKFVSFKLRASLNSVMKSCIICSILP